MADTVIETESPTKLAQDENSQANMDVDNEGKGDNDGEENKEEMEEEEIWRTVCISNLSDSLKEDQLRDLFKACGDIEVLCIKLKLGQGRVCYIRFSNNDSAQTALLLNDKSLDSKPLQIKLVNDEILANYKETTPPNTASFTITPQSGNNSGLPLSVAEAIQAIDQQQSALQTVQQMSGAKKSIITAGDINSITNGLITEDSVMRGKEEEERQEKLARTIYVGNLNPMIQSEHLSEFFSVCGKVNLVKIAGNSTNAQAARYGFVEFENLEAARSAYNLSGHFLLDRPIKIGPAKNAILNPHPSKANIITNPVKINHAMAKVRLLQQRIQNRYHTNDDTSERRETTKDSKRKHRSKSRDRHRSRSRDRSKRKRERRHRRDRDRDRDRDSQRKKSQIKVDKPISKRNDSDKLDKDESEKKKRERKKESKPKKVSKSDRKEKSKKGTKSDRYHSRHSSKYRYRSRSRSRSRSPKYDRYRRRSRSRSRDRDRSRSRNSKKKREAIKGKKEKKEKSVHKTDKNEKSKDEKSEKSEQNNNDNSETITILALTAEDNNDVPMKDKERAGMIWDGFQWHPAPTSLNVSDYRASKYPPHLLNNANNHNSLLSPNIQQAAALAACGTKLNTKYPPNPMNACPLVNPDIAAACAAAAAAAGKLTPQQATILKLNLSTKVAMGGMDGKLNNTIGNASAQSSSLMAHQLSSNAVQQQMNKFFPNL